jgi:hypothetical protein
MTDRREASTPAMAKAAAAVHPMGASMARPFTETVIVSAIVGQAFQPDVL